VPARRSRIWELKGLEPLTPSLGTRGIAVDQACLSTDLGLRRQRKSKIEAQEWRTASRHVASVDCRNERALDGQGTRKPCLAWARLCFISFGRRDLEEPFWLSVVSSWRLNAAAMRGDPRGCRRLQGLLMRVGRVDERPTLGGGRSRTSAVLRTLCA
jgi:hypothetical protein